jgi:hypothetical protein
VTSITTNAPSGFLVQRATGAGAFATVATINYSTMLNYTDITVAPGTSYTYRIIATNGVGNSAPSNTQTITSASWAAPTVILTAPASGAAPGPIPLSATVTAGGGTVTKVEYYNGGILVGSRGAATAPAFSYNWTGMSAGTYSLTAKVYNSLGATAVSSAVTVNLVNIANVDFNSDGNPDILWRDSTTGQNVVWFMTGTTHTGDGSVQSVPTNWNIVGVGDFNGDSNTDILWRDSTSGQTIIWLMTGTTHTSDVSLGTVPTNWEIVSVGDFNTDSNPDILWRDSTTGQNVVWFMNGTTHTSDGSVQSVPTNWKIVGVGDFNADTNPDILWRDSTTGQNVVWFMNGTTHTSDGSVQSVPIGWDIVGVKDYNADTNPDILWRDSATGQIIIWLMNGTTHTSDVSLGSVPTNWKIVGH